MKTETDKLKAKLVCMLLLRPYRNPLTLCIRKASQAQQKPAALKQDSVCTNYPHRNFEAQVKLVTWILLFRIHKYDNLASRHSLALLVHESPMEKPIFWNAAFLSACAADLQLSWDSSHHRSLSQV